MQAGSSEGEAKLEKRRVEGIAGDHVLSYQGIPLYQDVGKGASAVQLAMAMASHYTQPLTRNSPACALGSRRPAGFSPV